MNTIIFSAGTNVSLYIQRMSGMPGKGKVLLMDDEQIILDMTREVLKFLEYEVMFAKDGREAIELYKKEQASGEPFDIVILDLFIPHGLGGKETIEELRKIDPQVKSVISTGYMEDPVVRDFSSYGFDERLVKPYRIPELKNLLEKLMKK
jgi:CheY-like chemotaxis protein